MKIIEKVIAAFLNKKMLPIAPENKMQTLSNSTTAINCLAKTNKLEEIPCKYPNPKTRERDPSNQSFNVLLDAIHYMFSHGYGEFSIRK